MYKHGMDRVYPMKYAHILVVVCLVLVMLCYSASLIFVMYFPISFRIASLALGQSYDCPSAREVTLKDMGKIGWYITTTKCNWA